MYLVSLDACVVIIIVLPADCIELCIIFMKLYDLFVTKVGIWSCCIVAKSVYLLCMAFALSTAGMVHNCELCC